MLYDLVHDRRDDLLAECLRALRSDHPDRSAAELLDGLPEFVDLLESALRGQSLASQIQASAYRHGLARRSRRFDVGSVVHDYGLVCDVISKFGTQRGASFEARDVGIMNQSIDTAIAGAIEAYWHAAQLAPGQEGAEHLGVFAHEVRNAAQTASMAVALLKRGQVSTTGATMGVLERALREIERTVTTALSEARLGGSSLRTERLDLATFLTQVAAAVGPERGVRVELQVPGGIALHADPQHLTAAVGNVLRNAVKFTRDGEAVRMRARQAGDMAVIEVEDRCGGLPAGMAQALFEPFVQRTDRRTGAGLGLAIARKAVAAHGGTLTVEDLPGVGCVFRIAVPLSPHAARA